ncbi:hypothetical protein EV138_3686 [Kribbella voronezhensis]|uniref:Ricin-type beta-trefoil lectin protein n=1 Tax=Kribbella voronezhensis TaxID=2512212 RepID=A0A4V3FKG3_9ACTN|nr:MULTISPECIES: hypothetical protein [Kribbella]TDU90103.1 hypothetical protein EV138_3686 [Kribbella voronezhensis]
MQVTRKIAAAAAVATVATLGLATVVSANMLDNPTANNAGLADAASLASKGYGHGGTKWYAAHHDGSLVALDGNSIGPLQACHNFIPVNAVGAQVPVKDITAIIGFNQAGNTATAVKTCEMNSKNNTHKWYRAEGGLISVSDNAVGPFQVCHNDVPVNAVGAQVPVSDITGLLGFNQAGNSVDQLQTCELDSVNN